VNIVLVDECRDNPLRKFRKLDYLPCLVPLIEGPHRTFPQPQGSESFPRLFSEVPRCEVPDYYGYTGCGKKRKETVPQGLKPMESQAFNVGAKAPTPDAKHFFRKLSGMQ
jgi:hypothetical protein